MTERKPMNNPQPKISAITHRPAPRSGTVIVSVRALPSRVGETVAAHIATFVGPHTAKVAVTTFARRAVGCEPEHLQPRDVPALLAALRPMLRTLLGHAQCEILLRRLEQSLPS